MVNITEREYQQYPFQKRTERSVLHYFYSIDPGGTVSSVGGSLLIYLNGMPLALMSIHNSGEGGSHSPSILL